MSSNRAGVRGRALLEMVELFTSHIRKISTLPLYRICLVYSSGKEKKMMDVDVRADGRTLNQLRPLTCSRNVLNRAHGSARWSQGKP